MTNDDVGQAILQAVERINGRLDRMESRLDGLESRMSVIEQVVAELNAELKSWPDMHFLAASTKAQTTHTRELRADVSDIKVRMSEIYQSMATEPEIRNLRDDVARFRDQSLNLEVRVGTIESHLGLDSSLTPR